MLSFGYSFLYKLLQADHCFARLGTAYSGKGQKIVDQVSHPFRSFQDDRHISVAFVIEQRSGICFQKLGEPDDMAKRRAEVMRYRVGKCLQFLIDGLELSGSCSKLFVERANFMLTLGPYSDFFLELVAGLQKLSLDAATDRADLPRA